MTTLACPLYGHAIWCCLSHLCTRLVEDIGALEVFQLGLLNYYTYYFAMILSIVKPAAYFKRIPRPKHF